MYRRYRIKPYFKPRKNKHFLGALEQFFGIIALEELFRAYTCVKIAWQETLIKWSLFGSRIIFYVFILLKKEKNDIKWEHGICINCSVLGITYKKPLVILREARNLIFNVLGRIFRRVVLFRRCGRTPSIPPPKGMEKL